MLRLAKVRLLRRSSSKQWRSTWHWLHLAWRRLNPEEADDVAILQLALLQEHSWCSILAVLQRLQWQVCEDRWLVCASRNLQCCSDRRAFLQCSCQSLEWACQAVWSGRSSWSLLHHRSMLAERQLPLEVQRRRLSTQASEDYIWWVFTEVSLERERHQAWLSQVQWSMCQCVQQDLLI